MTRQTAEISRALSGNFHIGQGAVHPHRQSLPDHSLTAQAGNAEQEGAEEMGLAAAHAPAHLGAASLAVSPTPSWS